MRRGAPGETGTQSRSVVTLVRVAAASFTRNGRCCESGKEASAMRIEPLLWLPDDCLDVVDFDLSDDDVIAGAELLPSKSRSMTTDG